jgi:DNA-binding MarR family transcriptional regulator
MASKANTKTAAECAYVLGEDGLNRWSDTHADAWIGLLEAHKRLTRALEAELEAEHGLSLSGVEVLARLAGADERTMKLSALATETGLSLSRISRICDMLQARALIERVPSPDDARVVEAHLTGAGLKLVRKAQATHFAGVQERFFDQLDASEIRVLADVFARFVPADAGACKSV